MLLHRLPVRQQAGLDLRSVRSSAPTTKSAVAATCLAFTATTTIAAADTTTATARTTFATSAAHVLLSRCPSVQSKHRVRLPG